MSDHDHGHKEEHGHEHNGCCGHDKKEESEHDHGHKEEHGHGHKEEHDHVHDGCCGHDKKEEHGNGHSHGHAEEPQATGEDICGDGGVLKTVDKAGDASSGHPPAGSKVRVHYVGTLMDGSKFDSSRDRPGFFEFTIGEGQVIKGWDAGVATMVKGEVATLVCRSDYAYGAHGSPPKIPGGATLKFEVELFGWKEQRKEKWKMSNTERVDTAIEYKEKGTKAFKAGQFEEAREWYHDAADLLCGRVDSGAADDFEAPDGRGDEVKALLTSCQLNEAQMCIKLQVWFAVVEVCSEVLGREPENVKALFRRGTALAKESDFAEAKADLAAAAKLDPKSKEIRAAYAEAKEAADAAKAKDKAMAAKMFG